MNSLSRTHPERRRAISTVHTFSLLSIYQSAARFQSRPDLHSKESSPIRTSILDRCQIFYLRKREHSK
jgi:hypothetical protein